MINSVLLGDCLEVMKNILSGSVDMLFIDLPYGITAATWDCLIDLKAFWAEAHRVLKLNGVIVATCTFPFTYTLAASNIENLKYDMVWHKTSPTGHLNAKKRPLRTHENVLIFYRKPPTYNPQKTFGHELKTSTAANKRNSKNTELYGEYKATGYSSTERYPRSVLTFKTDKQISSLHSTQKPVNLIEYFILTYTNEGDTVLDPCAGSGTTGVACINTNRNYILIEKEQKYHDIILNRLEWATELIW